MSTSTISAKGSVTIPEELRLRLGLRAGDRLDVEADPGGNLILRPARKRRENQGRFPGRLRHLAKDRPASIDEMKSAVAEEAAERFRAATRR